MVKERDGQHRKATRVLGTERAKRKTSRASRIQGGCFEAWARGGGSAGQAVERLLTRCISEACMQVLSIGIVVRAAGRRMTLLVEFCPVKQSASLSKVIQDAFPCEPPGHFVGGVIENTPPSLFNCWSIRVSIACETARPPSAKPNCWQKCSLQKNITG